MNYASAISTILKFLSESFPHFQEDAEKHLTEIAEAEAQKLVEKLHPPVPAPVAVASVPVK